MNIYNYYRNDLFLRENLFNVVNKYDHKVYNRSFGYNPFVLRIKKIDNKYNSNYTLNDYFFKSFFIYNKKTIKYYNSIKVLFFIFSILKSIVILMSF